MADIDRRRRLAGQLRRFLKLELEEKNIPGALRLSDRICALEGWQIKDSAGDFPDPVAPPTDLSPLVQLLDK